MIWIEMSIDMNHGGKGWGFSECLWSPSYRMVKGKREKWGYWESLKNVKAGDQILHLRGEGENCKIVGHSIAETNGFRTTNKPSDLGVNWGYADEFYRVNLRDYVELEWPIRLIDIFKKNDIAFRNYYEKNKLNKQKKKLFYVIQGGKLQKQNGAYLSEVDDELFDLLIPKRLANGFGEDEESYGAPNRNSSVGEENRNVKTRKGQSEFASNVKANFNGKCCFPNCDIRDLDFLVGAHIARWADCEEHRGETSNGLCLCLIHDKAFEKGLYTLDSKLRVRLNHEILEAYSNEIHKYLDAEGIEIKSRTLEIESKFLKMHWTRIGFTPE